MDGNSIEKFGQQIVQILCSHPCGFGYTSLAEFKQDFRKFEGFDPEQKAREFGYETLRDLLQADVMRPYIIVQRDPQLPNMPIMRYRGIDRSGIEREIRIEQQDLIRRKQKREYWWRQQLVQVGQPQRQRGVGLQLQSRHAAVIPHPLLMQINPMQNRFENNHEFLTEDEEDQNRNDGNANGNCFEKTNAPPISLSKIASPSPFSNITNLQYPLLPCTSTPLGLEEMPLAKTKTDNHNQSQHQHVISSWKRFANPKDLIKDVLRVNGKCAEFPHYNIVETPTDSRNPLRRIKLPRDLPVPAFGAPSTSTQKAASSPFNVGPLVQLLQNMDIQDKLEKSNRNESVANYSFHNQQQSDVEQSNGGRKVQKESCQFCVEKDFIIAKLRGENCEFKKNACHQCKKAMFKPNSPVHQQSLTASMIWREPEPENAIVPAATDATKPLNSSYLDLFLNMSNNIGSSFSRFLSSSYMNRSELKGEEENGQKQENDDYERSRILNEFLDFDASRTTLENVPMPTPPSPPAVQQPHRRSGKGISTFIWHDQFYRRCSQCPSMQTFQHFNKVKHERIDDNDNTNNDGTMNVTRDETSEEEGEDEHEHNELGQTSSANVNERRGKDLTNQLVGTSWMNHQNVADLELTPKRSGKLGTAAAGHIRTRRFGKVLNAQLNETMHGMNGQQQRQPELIGQPQEADEEGNQSEEIDEEQQENIRPPPPPAAAINPPPINRALCQICNRQFDSPQGMKIHRNKAHKDILARGGAQLALDDVFPCDVPNCTSILSSPKLLQRHKVSMHSQRDFACELCGATYMKQSYLERHIQNKH